MEFLAICLVISFALAASMVRKVRRNHYGEVWSLGKRVREVPSGWVLVLPVFQQLKQFPTDRGRSSSEGGL